MYIYTDLDLEIITDVKRDIFGGINKQVGQSTFSELTYIV